MGLPPSETGGSFEPVAVSNPSTDTDILHVVFNVNYGGLGGFGATLTSLIRHCSRPERLMIHIMCSNLAPRHKWDITAALTQLGYPGHYAYIDYDAEAAFGHLPKLHGDLTTYGRLLMAE